MANYLQLKAAIDQVIKANGQKEITGPVLNDTLKAIVNSLGAGYQFRGVATPSTNPGTTDQNVFYIAGQAGTYTNFNSIVLPDDVSILKWNGSWSSETVVAGDGVFDISAYKATGGTLATFADLSAALDGGNNIPQSRQKGGMSVKFVQSSDNSYVQFRCKTQSFSTDPGDWYFDGDDTLIENPKFIEAKTDSEGKLLEARKVDGTKIEYCDVEYPNGIPSSIRNYINTREAKNPKVIHIGDFQGAAYSEIQDALNDIDDDTPSNPYLLLIHPKGTPYASFSMIRSSFSQTYPWNNIAPRNISIVGLDKEHCIIKSDKGDYYYPPSELLTNGIIKNMTFIMTNDNYTASSAKQGGYAAHIDCRTKDDVGYKMLIEDCYFSSTTGPAVGIGLHSNVNLTFSRCTFISTADTEYEPVDGYVNLANWGCVYMHSSTVSTATNQFASFVDCIGKTVQGARSLWLSLVNGGSADGEITLLRNVFWRINAGVPGYQLDSGLNYNPMNFGNNIEQV